MAVSKCSWTPVGIAQETHAVCRASESLAVRKGVHDIMVYCFAVYLVFGAAGSIGSALSQRLVAGRYGTPAAVVLTDAADDRLQQLKQKLQGPVSVMPADATKAEEVCEGPRELKGLGFRVQGP